MLKVISEQINVAGVVTETQTHAAISADCAIAGNVVGAGTVHVRSAGGVNFQIPVGGKLGDFQRVRVYGKDGTLVGSLTFVDGEVVYAPEHVADKP